MALTLVRYGKGSVDVSFRTLQVRVQFEKTDLRFSGDSKRPNSSASQLLELDTSMKTSFSCPGTITSLMWQCDASKTDSPDLAVQLNLSPEINPREGGLAESICDFRPFAASNLNQDQPVFVELKEQFVLNARCTRSPFCTSTSRTRPAFHERQL